MTARIFRFLWCPEPTDINEVIDAAGERWWCPSPGRGGQWACENETTATWPALIDMRGPLREVVADGAARRP